jgi:hypothetical protein
MDHSQLFALILFATLLTHNEKEVSEGLFFTAAYALLIYFIITP